jgi:formylglycine-generating enzyme required for sulfatase activity
MAEEAQEQVVRLASIVAIDVAGFSTMSERDQRRAAQAIAALHTRIDAVAVKNNGRIFNTAGDGFMLEFGSAGAALGCIQDLLDKRPKGQPPIRIGAHVGDVIVTITNDLLGHGVNIAARLQSLAVPNTALVSGEFRSMARSSPSVAFQAKGRQPLENIDQRVQTFAIVSGAERTRRMVVQGAVSLVAVAALTLLAVFGAQIGEVIESAHVLQYVGLEAKSERGATPAAAQASEIKPPPVKEAPIAAPVPPTAPAAIVRKAGDLFRDCESCPEMIVAPGGVFMMGSPAKEKPRFANEGPQREVTIEAFAVSRYEVTFAEWDSCLAASACGGYSPADHGWGRGRRPVIGISWNDAQAYVDWLNKSAGKPAYRLLSEAQWEYLARGGGDLPYGAAKTITRATANFGSGRSDPVGSYNANSYGVFDLAGNANEWVRDCYAPTYTGAPEDGGAVEPEKCALRVYRGGSYKDAASALRVANRRRAAPALRDFSIGFRVAREIE